MECRVRRLRNVVSAIQFLVDVDSFYFQSKSAFKIFHIHRQKRVARLSSFFSQVHSPLEEWRELRPWFIIASDCSNLTFHQSALSLVLRPVTRTNSPTSDYVSKSKQISLQIVGCINFITCSLQFRLIFLCVSFIQIFDWISFLCQNICERRRDGNWIKIDSATVREARAWSGIPIRRTLADYGFEIGTWHIRVEFTKMLLYSLALTLHVWSLSGLKSISETFLRIISNSSLGTHFHEKRISVLKNFGRDHQQWVLMQ